MLKIGGGAAGARPAPRRVSRPARRRLRALARACACGCARECHEHYRPGSDCGRCGGAACPAFRAAARGRG